MPKVAHRELQNAVNVVNAARRGPYDPPLVRVAKCDSCKQPFAIAAQHSTTTDVCRVCAREKRRESRRV